MYVINYLNPEHDYLKMDVDTLWKTHWPSLQRVFPGFVESDVLQKLLFKSPAASPLYDLGFKSKMPPFQGLAKNIGLLGMSQVYPIDRNMNHCIQVALEADMARFLE